MWLPVMATGPHTGEQARTLSFKVSQTWVLTFMVVKYWQSSQGLAIYLLGCLSPALVLTVPRVSLWLRRNSPLVHSLQASYHLAPIFILM